jgi:tripartite-type tricarboxylate transporter receptor subunit TctC
MVWFGLLAPKDVPDGIAAKLSSTIAKAVQVPAVRKFFTDRHVEPRGSTAEELSTLISNELKLWEPVIKKSKISL